MLITFNFVQRENLPAAFWEFLHGATQRNSVDSAKEAWIRFPHVPTERRRVRRNGLVKRQDWGRFAAAQLHQHSVHCHRYNQVEKAESPRNEPTLRNTCRK